MGCWFNCLHLPGPAPSSLLIVADVVLLCAVASLFVCCFLLVLFDVCCFCCCCRCCWLVLFSVCCCFLLSLWLVLIGVSFCYVRLKRNSYGFSFDRDSTVISLAWSCNLDPTGLSRFCFFPEGCGWSSLRVFLDCWFGSPNWKVEVEELLEKWWTIDGCCDLWCNIFYWYFYHTKSYSLVNSNNEADDNGFRGISQLAKR